MEDVFNKNRFLALIFSKNKIVIISVKYIALSIISPKLYVLRGKEIIFDKGGAQNKQ